MKLELHASIQGTNFLRFDDDGSGSVKLAFDASQAPQAVKMLLCRNQMLKVTVETEGG